MFIGFGLRNQFYLYNNYYTMTYIKRSDWSISSIDRDVVTQSEYNKATITYDKEYEVAVTEDVKEEITDTDAKGNTIVLGTRVVQKPKLDKEGKQVVKKEIMTVTHNPYDGYVIIPDDATILTEEEYKKEIEKLSNNNWNQ